jgi:hypothetical protein
MSVEKYFKTTVMNFDPFIVESVVKETFSKISIFGESNEEKEKSFRERYSQELKSKKQRIHDKYQGYNELDDENRKVRQQMMRTPGRRGEIIKQEEIDKEISRRYDESQINCV